MEPRIQYAKTSDGVNIAYSVMGEGPPFVIMPAAPLSELQAAPYVPDVQTFYNRLSPAHRLVRYDGRGSGLSDREVEDYSLEAHLLDLEAVVDGAGLETFAAWGMSSLAAAAITYAARHPERVTHLILLNAWWRGIDFFGSSDLEALVTLIDRNWALFTETIAHAMSDWDPGVNPRRLAEFIRESVTQESARRFFAAAREFDASEALPLVQTPTLILQRKQLQWPDVSVARSLAAAIHRAELVVLEGGYGWVGEQGVEAVLDFLGGRAASARSPELPSGTAVILFADIVDSTALTERMGDTAFREKARELDGALRAAIRECEGVPVEGKLLGDGVLAVFTSARQAIEAALACGTAGDEAGLPLHLGLHAGDVIREENNVYGGAVNIAARIAEAAAPGEVLVSDIVRGLARTSAGVAFDDRGEHSLKGVGEPQRLFAVREGGA